MKFNNLFCNQAFMMELMEQITERKPDFFRGLSNLLCVTKKASISEHFLESQANDKRLKAIFRTSTLFMEIFPQRREYDQQVLNYSVFN